MVQPKHLENAPIIEAVLDVRVKNRAGFSVSEFEKIGTALNTEFVIKKNVVEFQTNIRLKKDGPASADLNDQIVGFQFWSTDQLNVTSFRKDGFSFSRLRPYTNWAQVFGKMQPLWEAYLKIAQPELITRIAVRYINKVSIPAPVADFDDYFTAIAKVPKELPQFISNFLSRVVIHDPHSGLSAAITQVLEPLISGQPVVVLLDVDAYYNTSGDFKVDDPKIPIIFEQLREFKNRIFFASLTEKAIKLFE